MISLQEKAQKRSRKTQTQVNIYGTNICVGVVHLVEIVGGTNAVSETGIKMTGQFERVSLQ